MSVTTAILFLNVTMLLVNSAVTSVQSIMIYRSVKKDERL
jgi:hypothetical protein